MIKKRMIDRTRPFRRTTALGIPSPWDGNEWNPPGLAYVAWYRLLYRPLRTVRHWLRLHDWDSQGRQCTWCGKPWNA